MNGCGQRGAGLCGKMSFFNFRHVKFKVLVGYQLELSSRQLEIWASKLGEVINLEITNLEMVGRLGE